MFKSLVDYINLLLNGLKEDGATDDNKEGTYSENVNRIRYSFEQTEDFPESINDFVIYIVGENEFEWLAVLKCPCGCNDVIQLNLLEESTPSWELFRHRNRKLTISPSINRIVNCKSHFSILKGEVWWWGEWPTDDKFGF